MGGRMGGCYGWVLIGACNPTSIHPLLIPVSRQTCLEVPERKFSFMGFSVRSADYRYTEWRAWLAGDLAANWTAAPVAVELYNETGHFADSPLAFDHQPINIAGRAALVPVQQELHLALRQQFAPGTATAATEVYA